MDDEAWVYGLGGLVLGFCIGVVIILGATTAPLQDDYKILQRTYTEDSLKVVNQCTKIHYLELQHVVDSTRMVDYQRYIKLLEKSR